VKAPSPALRAAFGGALALAAAMGVGRFALTPLLPPMMQALHLGKHQAGLIASANFAGYLAGALAAAAPALSRRSGLWLTAGLAGSILTTALMGVSGDLAVLAGFRFLAGVASAFVLVFATARVLDRLANEGRPGLASLHFAGVGLGIASSAILVAVLAAQGVDWRLIWFACGALSLAAAAAGALLLPRDARAEVPAHDASTQPGGLRTIRPLLVAYALFGFGYVITATFLVAMVRASPEAAAVEPLVWVFVGLAGAPSVWLWLKAGRRIGLDRAYALACLIEAIGVAVGGLVENGWGAIVSSVLLGGTFMGLTALGLALTRELVPARASTGLAAMTAAFGLGQIIGPVVGGAWAEQAGGFARPSIAAAAALALAAVLALATRRRVQP
jgi:predicted MFS family arabinose efflux permease